MRSLRGIGGRRLFTSTFRSGVLRQNGTLKARALQKLGTVMSKPVQEPTTSGYAPQYDAADSARAARSYVDEILEKDADERDRKPVSPKRKQRGRTVFLFCVPLLLGLTGLNIKMRTAGVPPVTSAVADQEAHVGVYLAMQQVEAYRASNGLKLPTSLEAIGADAPGVEYVRDGERYRITAQVYEATAAYSSGDDPTPFEAAAAGLFTPEGRSQ